jgi:hypothetical protein
VTRGPRWSWHGLAALVLAVSLGGGYAAVLIISVVDDRHATGEGAQLLTNLGGILAGALAGWLGGAAAGHQRRDDQDPDDDT